MSARGQLLVVDGTYELFRAFYGAPPRMSRDGQEVGAALALARSLHALPRTANATHLAVAFDTVIESFRNALLPTYKTGEGIDPRLWSQFPLAEEVTRALGFKVLPMIDYEADDALASLAEAGITAGFERVILATPDKDLLQCVRDTHVITWDRLRQKYYDRAGVLQKLGIEPASVPDYLALVGDTADGIPGLSGWGARSASRVLSRYSHLESIPDEVEAWDRELTASVRGARTLAQTLESERNAALLYRTVATMRTDLVLFDDWDELVPGGRRTEDLAKLAYAWDADWLAEL